MTSVNAYLNTPVELYAGLNFEFQDNEPDPANTPLSKRADTGVFSMGDGSSVIVDKFGKFEFKPATGTTVQVGFDPALHSWRLPVIVRTMQGGIPIVVDETRGTMEAHIGGRVFSVSNGRGCQPDVGCNFTVKSRLETPHAGDYQQVTLIGTTVGSLDLSGHPLREKTASNLYGRLGGDLW